MDIHVLLETSRIIGLAALYAVLALSAGLLVLDRTPRTDAEDMAQPDQRHAA